MFDPRGQHPGLMEENAVDGRKQLRLYNHIGNGTRFQDFTLDSSSRHVVASNGVILMASLDTRRCISRQVSPHAAR